MLMNKRADPVKNISETQLAMLMFLSIMSTVTLFVPAITSQIAHRDSWLATGIIPSITGIINLFIVNKLSMMYPDQTIIQYGESIFGKILGKLFSFGYIAFLLITNIVIIRELTEFLSVMLLPGTSILVLNSIFTLSGLYVVPKGPEVLCRMGQFLLPLFLTFLIILIILTVPDWDLSRLTPIMAQGFSPIIRGSIVPTAWFGEIFLVAMFMPNVNKPQQMLQKGMITILILGTFLTIVTLSAVATFGPHLTAILTFPMMSLIKYIKISSIFQRLETYMIGFWVGAMFMKIMVFYYSLNEGIAQALNINNSKWILWMTALVQILGSTYLFSNTLDVSQFLAEIWVKIAFIFEFGLLIFFWFIALIRKKLERKPT